MAYFIDYGLYKDMWVLLVEEVVLEDLWQIENNLIIIIIN